MIKIRKAELGEENIVLDFYYHLIDDMQGAFIVNHIQGEGYQLVDWNKKGNDTEIAVLHLRAVSPKCQGQGLGKKMLEKVVETC